MSKTTPNCLLAAVAAILCTGLFASLSVTAVAGPTVLASEHLPAAGGNHYGPDNLSDRNLRGAWCFKVETGRRVRLTLQFDAPTPLAGLGWVNGYAKNRRVFRANARVRSLSVYADDRPLGRFHLDDRMDLQWLAMPKAMAVEYRFVVEAVYPGSKFADACITEIVRDRRGADAYALIDALARAAGRRALTDAEIRVDYLEIFQFYRSFFNQKGMPVASDRPFWDAVVLRASARDQGSLRFMLNLSRHANRQRTLPVSLTAGLRDLVTGYFEGTDASVVADVWQDKHQAERAVIQNAYVMFVDVWSSAQVSDHRRRNPGFDRVTGAFCKGAPVTGDYKPHFC